MHEQGEFCKDTPSPPHPAKEQKVCFGVFAATRAFLPHGPNLQGMPRPSEFDRSASNFYCFIHGPNRQRVLIISRPTMSGLARTSSYRKANATAEAEATETGALLHRPDQGVRSLLECAACDPLASPAWIV